MGNNIKRYRIKKDWFEQPATWNRYVRSEPWGDKSPQLGGKPQSSGQEPEISGRRFERDMEALGRLCDTGQTEEAERLLDQVVARYFPDSISAQRTKLREAVEELRRSIDDALPGWLQRLLNR